MRIGFNSLARTARLLMAFAMLSVVVVVADTSVNASTALADATQTAVVSPCIDADTDGCRVITVHKVGDQDGVDTPGDIANDGIGDAGVFDGGGRVVDGSDLSGATFEITGNGITDGDDIQCTTGGDGECQFIVPDGNGYSVTEVSAPTGFNTFSTFAYGQGSGDVGDVDAYLPRAVRDDDSDRDLYFVNRRNNPALPTSCGVDVALVFDRSGSIGSSGFTENFKTAGKDFVEALSGTNSNIALISFSASATLNQNYLNVGVEDGANEIELKSDIDAIYASTGGGTNWDDAFDVVAGLATTPDLVVFLTDGNPTVYANGSGSSSTVSIIDVEEAAQSANSVKAKGSRVIAFGILPSSGGSTNPVNLATISGPTQNSDWFTSANSSALQTFLAELAVDLCAPSVSATKVVPDAQGNLVPAAGWDFTGYFDGFTTPAVPATVDSPPGLQSPIDQTTAGSGIVTWEWNQDLGTTVDFTITEDLASQAGYVLDAISCTDQNGPLADNDVTVDLDGTSVTVTVANDAIVNCQFVNRLTPAGVKIVKTAGTAADGAAFEVTGPYPADVTYTYVITNTGDTNLADIVIVDDLGTPGDGGDDVTIDSSNCTEIDDLPASGLAPDASVTCTLVLPISADTTNVATVTANPVDDQGDDRADLDDVTDDDSAVVTISASPDIAIDKTVYPGHDSGLTCQGEDLITVDLGSDVTYCFTVENTGDTDLDVGDITDTTLGVTISVDLVLSPGQSVTKFVETTVTTLTGDDDGNDGRLTNTASVSGNPVDDQGNDLPGIDDVTDDDTAAVDPTDPDIAIDKTVYLGHDSGAGCPGSELATADSGEAVTYCFTVTNTGGTYLEAVTIDDADLGIDQADMTILAGDLFLAPGESVTLYYQTAIDGDLTNTALATGNPVDAEGTDIPDVDNPTDDDDAEVVDPEPALELAKTVYVGHDDGASCSAAGGGDELVTGGAGLAVTYCFVVTNTGDTHLADVTVDDPDVPGLILVADAANVDPLPVGQSAVFYGETTIEGDLTNTATASGDPVDDEGTPIPGEDPVGDDDSAEVAEVSAAIDLDKRVFVGHDAGASCDNALKSILVGDDVDITYCFTVTNTSAGIVHLDDIVVQDSTFGWSYGDGGTDELTARADLSDTPPLAPGEAIVLFIETTGGTEDVTNDATATANPTDSEGTDLPGVEDPSDDSSAEVDVVDPDIEITKTVYFGTEDPVTGCPGSDSVVAQLGDSVTYCFVVTNTGDTHLADVTVDDPDLGINEADMTPVTGGAPLAPGESLTLAYVATVEGDLANTAVAGGTPTDPDGGEIPGAEDPSDDDTADVDEVSPSIEISKTVAAGHASDNCPGDETLTGGSGLAITYCFVVTNTGDTHLIVSEVIDGDLGVTLPLPAPSQLLAPGDSVTLRYETLLEADLVNTADVVGNPVDEQGEDLPDIDDVDDEDFAAVNLVSPSISLAKTVYAGHDGGAGCPGTELVTGPNGTEVTYCFAITNTGDVALSQLVLRDLDLEIIIVLPVTLAPGDTIVRHVTRTIDGDLLNTAVVTGVAVDGNGNTIPGTDTVRDTDTARVNEVEAVVELSKTVYAGHDAGASCTGSEEITVDAGTDVTYCFEVVNLSTGGLLLDDIRIADDTLGITEADMTILTELSDSLPLAPGERVVLFYETVADEDLVNVATATGTPTEPGGEPLTGPEPPTDTDDATVAIAVDDVEVLPEVVDRPTGPLAFTGMDSMALALFGSALAAAGAILVAATRRRRGEAT
ncbi:MAG: VWA domain-containing protein [Acidimicrobiales bacterium]